MITAGVDWKISEQSPPEEMMMRSTIALRLWAGSMCTKLHKMTTRGLSLDQLIHDIFVVGVRDIPNRREGVRLRFLP